MEKNTISGWCIKLNVRPAINDDKLYNDNVKYTLEEFYVKVPYNTQVALCNETWEDRNEKNLEEIVSELELNNKAMKELQNRTEELRTQLIVELQNTETKNYRNDKALYSLKVNSNDRFNEDKFKEENEAIYNNYLKTKVSFDITTFKKKEKELVEKYTEKGKETYSLRVEANKTEEETPKQEVKEIEL